MPSSRLDGILVSDSVGSTLFGCCSIDATPIFDDERRGGGLDDVTVFFRGLIVVAVAVSVMFSSFLLSSISTFTSVFFCFFSAFGFLVGLLFLVSLPSTSLADFDLDGVSVTSVAPILSFSNYIIG